MSRLVASNKFALRAYALNVKDLGRPIEAAIKEAEEILAQSGIDYPINALEGKRPVILRWVQDKAYGLSRRPYIVYQRKPLSTVHLEPLRQEEVLMVTSAESVIEWKTPLKEHRMYIVSLDFSSLIPGKLFRVEAMDRFGKSIAGQMHQTSSNSFVRISFKSPSISKLKVTGKGYLKNISGIEETAYANLEDWVEIERVGFPFKEGEITAPTYQAWPQGYAEHPLDGRTASLARVLIARAFHCPMPDPTPLGVEPLTWPAPEGENFLTWLRTDPLKMIQECLENSDDYDSGRLQADFEAIRISNGLQQIDMPPVEGESSMIRIPVVGTTLLAVGNDSYMSTALGFGTLVFADLKENSSFGFPPDTLNLETDFMVVNHFVRAEEFESELEEFAALAYSKPKPNKPVNLEVAGQYENRPAFRDQPATESVKLWWDAPQDYHGYAIGMHHSTLGTTLRNSLYGSLDGRFPFNPPIEYANMQGNEPPLEKMAYIEPALPLPVTGSQQVTYLTVGLDVFGRWSRWTKIDHIQQAISIQRPGLLQVAFSLTIPGGPLYGGQMEIDFSWDWADRSPAKIELFGLFFPTGETPPSSYSSGFHLENSGGLLPRVVIAFDAETEDPVLEEPYSGKVIRLPLQTPLENGNTDLRQYRLFLGGIQCQFSNEAELSFALFAQAEERIRPGESSQLTGPLVARIIDPTPPAIPEISAALHWTALPDSTGVARGLIQWPVVPNAKGYNIWEATEESLVAIFGKSGEDRTSRSKADRAIELKTMMTGGGERSLEAFSKINRELVRKEQYEFSIPGASETIYLFKISAVNQQNLDSAKSETTFYAVPHRNEPLKPRVLLRQSKENPKGIWVLALPGGGPRSAGYRIYRTHKVGAAEEIGLMGPPKVMETDLRWISFSVLLERTEFSYLHAILKNLTSREQEEGKAFLDIVEPRWQSYYYRVVALGEENRLEGRLMGESSPSAVAEIIVLPAQPPELRNLKFIQGGWALGSSILVNQPQQVTVACEENRVYLVSNKQNLVQLDSQSEQKIASRSFLGRNVAISYEPISKKVFLLNRTPSNLTVFQTTPLAPFKTYLLFGNPNDFCLADNGGRVLITTSQGKLLEVETTSFQIARSIPLGGVYSGCAVHQGKNELYLANESNPKAIVLDLGTLTPKRSQSLPFSPKKLVVEEVAGRLFLSENAGGRVIVLDSDSLNTIGLLSFSGVVMDLKIQPSLKQVYVLTDKGKLFLVDSTDLRLIEEITLQGQAEGVGPCAGKDKLFVTGTSQNKVWVLQPVHDNMVFQFDANLPVQHSPVGKPSLQIIPSDIKEGKLFRYPPILDTYPVIIPVGPPLQPIANASEDQLNAMPEISRSENGEGGFVRYTLRVATKSWISESALLPQKILSLRLRDPLGRSVEEELKPKSDAN